MRDAEGDDSDLTTRSFAGTSRQRHRSRHRAGRWRRKAPLPRPADLSTQRAAQRTSYQGRGQCRRAIAIEADWRRCHRHRCYGGTRTPVGRASAGSTSFVNMPASPLTSTSWILTEAGWDRIHRVNSICVFFCCNRRLPQMIKQLSRTGSGAASQHGLDQHRGHPARRTQLCREQGLRSPRCTDEGRAAARPLTNINRQRALPG